jgi:hypothetical protein
VTSIAHARAGEAGTMTDDEKTKAQEEICRRLIEGESLRAICAGEDMPCRMTVCRWLAAEEGFRTMYAMARKLQAETYQDEIVDISDTPQIGIKKTTREWGTEVAEGDMVEHRRLRVDARKWAASKLDPKKYGEASLVKLADNEGNRLTEMDDTQRAVRLAAICASISARQNRALDHD